MKRYAIICALLAVFGGASAQAASGTLPRRGDTAVDVQVDSILQENALYYSILTGIGITLSISDPIFGFDVDDINMNLITRSLRDKSGKQQVVFRLGGVVRSNNNVEMNLLDSKGLRLGRFFYGYRSGDLIFYDVDEQVIISGFIDSGGRFSLSDRRLPADRQLLASGRFIWCPGCPGFDFVWYDGRGLLVARGFIFFWPESSFPKGIDRIRTRWAIDAGNLDASTRTLVDAEYDLRKEATGSLNSNLFDRRPAAESFFLHPYDLLTPLPGLAWLPRVVDDTTLSISNDSDKEARITITARHYDGTLLRGDGITNPITYLFGPGLQTTALPSDYLRGFSDHDRRPLLPQGTLPVWMEITGDQIGLRVLYFDKNQIDLEGAAATRVASRQFILDSLRFVPGTQQDITMLNLSHNPASVQLQAYDSAGALLARADRFFVPARGFRSFILGDFPELFPGLDFSGVVALRAETKSGGTGLTTSVLQRGPGGSLEMVQDRRDTEGSEVLWSPFFVTGGTASGRWTSRVSLTEAAGQETSIRIEAYTPEGRALSAQERDLRPRGSLALEASELLGGQPESLVRGYLRISSSGKLLGSISFRYESLEGTAASALPLPANPALSHAFYQVVQGSTEQSKYYTGLVLLNPSDNTAQVTVTAVDGEGHETARTTFVVPPQSSRFSLLDELFGGGFKQTGGSLRVVSSTPVFSYVLFGNSSGTVLSAIPAFTSGQ